MMSHPVCRTNSILGRADLLRAMACDSSVGSAEIVSAMAVLIGMKVRKKDESVAEPSLESIGIAIPNSRVELPISSGYPDNLENIACWLPTYYERIQSASDTLPEKEKQEARLAWTNPPKKRPTYQPLLPWKSLRSLLKDTTHPISTSHSIDIGKLTRHIAQGEFIRSIPKRSQRRSTQRLNLVIDRSSRLIPFTHDQDLVWRHLQQALPHGRLRLFECHSPFQMVTATSDGFTEDASYIERQLLDGSVLILGDLGVLDKNQPMEKQWLAWVRRLHQRGVCISALVPYSLDRIPSAFTSYLQAIPWQGSAVTNVRDAEERDRLVEDLQAMTGKNPSQFAGPKRPVEKVSFVDVIDALEGLSQRLFGLNAGLPSEAQWEYACRAGPTTAYNVGDTLSPKDANFARELNGTCDVKRYRPNAWGLFDTHGNVWEWCRDGERIYSITPQVDPTGDLGGSYRVLRGGSWFYSARYVRSACRVRSDPGSRSDGLGFRLLSSASAEPNEMVEVPVAEQGSEPSRFGAAEVFSHVFSVHDIDTEPIEFPLAELVPVSTQPTLKSESEPARSTRTSTFFLSSNLEKIRYERVEKPEWAVAYGQDPYGTYADILLDGLGVDDIPVRQRLRWIPPGRFQMGSPDGEPGRREDEILHDVILSHGYWMFDTPCTQRLWQAVMSNNPSTFKDPDRPIENVSWNDANEFAASWNRKLTRFAIEFRLPTEAEWEYACRAGTASAIYSGDLEILGTANAPALDAIAWYGGNSGYEYDLDESQSLEYSWLRDQQYPAKRGGTRKVKGKAPNALGLYDMLGNVWEWCLDGMREYSRTPQVDPTGDLGGSYRVIRGGGWIDNARLVRSACRSGLDPGYRLDVLGFRLLSSARKTEQVQAVNGESGSKGRPRDEAERRTSDRSESHRVFSPHPDSGREVGGEG